MQGAEGALHLLLCLMCFQCHACCTGLGLNAALEDAPELAWFIQQQGLSADTLRAFERDRAPRLAQIVRQEEVLEPARL